MPTHTFITEVFRFDACVQQFKRNVKVKVTAYSYNDSVSTTHINSKATPTTNNDYGSHIKAAALV